MRKVGKKVGPCIYVHKRYQNRVVSQKDIDKALKLAGREAEGYTCIRYNTRSGSIAFQFSSDFDTADEPILDKSVLVKADGNVTVTKKPVDPQVWHHKWMWVGEDYEGFDVEASKERSAMWAQHVTKKDMHHIGRLSYWKKVMARWKSDKGP